MLHRAATRHAGVERPRWMVPAAAGAVVLAVVLSGLIPALGEPR
jgi:hypothetical protein